MIKGLYTAASGMLVNEIRNDVVANNLANVNTNGYKRDMTVFKSYSDLLLSRINDYELKFGHIEIDKSPLVGKVGTCVIVDEVATDFSPGSQIQTGADLDFAINGKGFFIVKDSDGNYNFTRKGNFSVNADGKLVDFFGNSVIVEKEPALSTKENVIIDKNGKPMLGLSEFTLPKNAKIKVDETGAIFDEQGNRLGYKLAIANYDPKAMKKIGDNLWRPIGTNDIKGLKDVTITQGALETSNVKAVFEMTELIRVQRIYEANQRVITSTDKTLGQSVTQLGKAT